MRRVVDVALMGFGLFAALACSSQSEGDDASHDEGNAGARSSAGGSEGGASGAKGRAGSGGSSAQGGTTGTAGSAGEGAAGVAAGGTGGSDAQRGQDARGGTGGSASGTGGVTAGGGGSSGGAQGGGGSGGTGAPSGGAGGATTKYTLTIEFIGDVPGEIMNSLYAFTCEQTCTRTLPKDHEDTYRAQPQNGAGTYFAGFGGDCEGLPECELRMDEDKHITVEFREQTHNFVFLSSRGESTSHGGAAKFDENCNALATAAGINNDTNDAYIAWVSGDDSLALDRLGTTARGWVRLDGKPVADTVEDLLAGKLFHTIRLDDTGAVHDNEIVGTSTLADGSAAPDNCDNWRSESAGYDFAYGSDSGGPTYWTESSTRPCNIGMRFYCFGTNFSEPVTLTSEEGKLIYLSDPYVPNADMTPDEACAASAPAGTGEVRAMLSYGDKAGADVLSNGTLYVRPDGQVVGRGADVAEAAAPGVQGTVDDYLQTGIWQAGDGTYLNEADSAVWVGDINITRESAGECDNFTTSTGSATVGDYRESGARFWNQEYGDRYRHCDIPHRFYCVEQ